MGTTATIPTIGSAHSREFISHKVLITSTSVATAAKYSDLINKVTFLQNGIFCESRFTAGLQIYLKEARSKKLEARRGVLRGCFLVEGIFSHPGIFLPQQYNPADGADWTAD